MYKSGMTKISRGFTLVELLIVIAILAVLATATVVVLNPSELLKQARDSQRISDMDTLKNAIAVYITQVDAPSLGTICLNTTNKGCCTIGTTSPFTGTGAVCLTNVIRLTDGTGWVSVNFGGMSGGSPIPFLPLDPSQTAAYYYSYINTASPTLTFEINCVLESVKYAPKMANTADGGNNANFYEVGTDPALDL